MEIRRLDLGERGDRIAITDEKVGVPLLNVYITPGQARRLLTALDDFFSMDDGPDEDERDVDG